MNNIKTANIKQDGLFVKPMEMFVFFDFSAIVDSFLTFSCDIMLGDESNPAGRAIDNRPYEINAIFILHFTFYILHLHSPGGRFYL